MSDERPGHLEEDELILHYYGESPAAAAVESHLGDCAACRAAWDALCAALDAVTDETAGPAAMERSPLDIDRLWLGLRPRLQAAGRRQALRRAVLAPLAAAAALVLAFLAGRQWPPPSASPAPVASEAQVRERVLLVAVGEHLERSQMLLLELANAPADRPVDIAVEQERAEDLVGANRLYRAAAVRAGEPAMASVLDELERLFLEVARSPEQLRPRQMERLQRRIESRGLLFKVRVLESNVRQQQKQEPPARAGTIS